ncbi:MAG: Holliday junction branch migration DNA helicase RuvB [Candidatus Goldbacteria bacterium]|nr:Holliday junction branch migration DNA helicase RuvB [Candidatus Goldiibacteriota bacterium]HPD18652.1 Holliday junction branch migration DNA helicase RuvB [Candidatus Goldiibacteriota bacterium]
MKKEENKEDRIIKSEIEPYENFFEKDLRPKYLKDYIGQDAVKEKLKILIEAAKKRNEPPEHILFHGPPGLGKTTLAHIIANEMGVNIKITAGPVIEKAGDLAAIITNLEENDILFIDEIHRLNKAVEEIMYPALEDFVLDIVIGKGPSAKTFRINLPKFTLIGATTRAGLIASPLRDRFGASYRLDFYTPDDIEKILSRSIKILNIDSDREGIAEIARRSRGTPRIANRILKRVRDYAQVKGSGIIDKKITIEALKMLEIDEMGLDSMDKKIMLTVINKFKGGPVGIETLAVAVSEEPGTIEDVYEPYLIQIGFIQRTQSGRKATQRAYEYFGIKMDKEGMLF